MRRVATIVIAAAPFVALASGGVHTLSGCEPEKVVRHRDNCNVCHQPLDIHGMPAGLEEAHPWEKLSCADCHGGNPRICDGEVLNANECSTGWVYDKDRAHVDPGDSPKFIRNLTATELDAVDPAYIRFINPGDYRVADQTCGGGALGRACHASIVAGVQNSTMAHTSGEITVARYRAGVQDAPYAEFGAVALKDPNKDPNDACQAESIEKYDPPEIDIHSTDPENAPSVGTAQDQYMAKSCFRCHLNSFGENRFSGDFRSSGCTACHMRYANDGFSQSADPTINKLTQPHPVNHAMSLSPKIDDCVHCHYRGGRIGISYQGYREGPGEGLRPDNPGTLGEALHGHDANFYLTDENLDNDWDETPPDVHFEAGMHCVDCHVLSDVHGDGHIYADTQCAVSSECTDCHGTVYAYASVGPERDHIFERDGKLFLRTKVTNLELEIPQTLDSVTPGHPRHNARAELAMGVNESGFSHTDQVECYTCHAAWIPSCYGCHVTVDLTQLEAYDTTGVEHPGKSFGTRRWVQLNDLVLMRNTDGLIAPSMPAERFFMTLLALDEEESEKQNKTVKRALIDSSPRLFVEESGRRMAGFGQRTFNPHTTRRRSQFMACDRCHSVGDADAPDNVVLLDITHGFGSERYPQEACDVTNMDESCDRDTDFKTYQLDALQTRTGLPLVVVGHPDPFESRPLTLEEITRMRQVVVEPGAIGIDTPIASDALTNPFWPPAIQVE